VDQAVFEEIEKTIKGYCRAKCDGEVVEGNWRSRWRLELPESQATVNHIFDVTEKEKIQRFILKKGEIYLAIESDMLVSRPFVCLLPSNSDANIFVPLMHYKYEYKFFDVDGKKFKVKNFIKNKTPFYQHYEGEDTLEWDERFYIDRPIYDKMDGRLPITNPSPILHNWGEHKQIIYTNTDKEVRLSNAMLSIHKFERIRNNG